MKLLLFLQLKDLVRAVLNPPDWCPGYVQNVLGHSLDHMDTADGAGHAGAVLESPGGWQELKCFKPRCPNKEGME